MGDAARKTCSPDRSMGTIPTANEYLEASIALELPALLTPTPKTFPRSTDNKKVAYRSSHFWTAPELSSPFSARGYRSWVLGHSQSTGDSTVDLRRREEICPVKVEASAYSSQVRRLFLPRAGTLDYFADTASKTVLGGPLARCFYQTVRHAQGYRNDQ